jgi:hypothetical protein
MQSKLIQMVWKYHSYTACALFKRPAWMNIVAMRNTAWNIGWTRIFIPKTTYILQVQKLNHFTSFVLSWIIGFVDSQPSCIVLWSVIYEVVFLSTGMMLVFINVTSCFARVKYHTKWGIEVVYGRYLSLHSKAMFSDFNNLRVCFKWSVGRWQCDSELICLKCLNRICCKYSSRISAYWWDWKFYTAKWLSSVNYVFVFFCHYFRFIRVNRWTVFFLRTFFPFQFIASSSLFSWCLTDIWTVLFWIMSKVPFF